MILSDAVLSLLGEQDHVIGRDSGHPPDLSEDAMPLVFEHAERSTGNEGN